MLLVGEEEWIESLNPLFIRSQFQIVNNRDIDMTTKFGLNPLFIRSQFQILELNYDPEKIFESQSLIHQVSVSDLHSSVAQSGFGKSLNPLFIRSQFQMS